MPIGKRRSHALGWQESNDTTGDIITWEVLGEAAAMRALPLATVDPQVGDQVWLLGRELQTKERTKV